jgi:hypothetical protein
MRSSQIAASVWQRSCLAVTSKSWSIIPHLASQSSDEDKCERRNASRRLFLFLIFGVTNCASVDSKSPLEISMRVDVFPAHAENHTPSFETHLQSNAITNAGGCLAASRLLPRPRSINLPLSIHEGIVGGGSVPMCPGRECQKRNDRCSPRSPATVS